LLMLLLLLLLLLVVKLAMMGCWGAPATPLNGRVELEQAVRMLDPQMGAQRIDPAVGGRAVGTHGPLGSVGVEVVPAIGHLLAARAASPHGARIAGRREHVVVRHGVM